jgi:hypothetical protein
MSVAAHQTALPGASWARACRQAQCGGGRRGDVGARLAGATSRGALAPSRALDLLGVVVNHTQKKKEHARRCRKTTQLSLINSQRAPVLEWPPIGPGRPSAGLSPGEKKRRRERVTDSKKHLRHLFGHLPGGPSVIVSPRRCIESSTLVAVRFLAFSPAHSSGAANAHGSGASIAARCS